MLKNCEKKIVDIDGETYSQLLVEIRDTVQALEAEGMQSVPDPLERYSNLSSFISPNMDNSAIVDEAGQKRKQEYATLLSKSHMLHVLDGSVEFINDVGIDDNVPLYQDICEVIDTLAPERGEELERLAEEEKVKSEQQPARQPFVPEPERDRDIEPEI